jgi:PST family polysaccharide transporter
MQVLSIIGILQSVVFFNGTVIRASGKPSWQFAIMLLNAVCSILGFLVTVHWGIVAVAISFVVVGYLLAPVSFMAVRRLIHVDVYTYLRQFAPPLFAALVMAAVIMGLKYVLTAQDLNSYVELSTYLLAGALTYIVVIVMTAPSLYRQVLELVSVVMPKWKLRRTL